MHAAFSVGALSGAALGTLCIALSVDLLTQMIVLCSTQMILPILVRRFVPQHTGQEEHHKNAEVEKPEKINLFKDKHIMFLGIGILCITLAEGAAVDWLALTVVKGFGETATNAGIAFAVFNLTMTITRFFGGNISDDGNYWFDWRADDDSRHIRDFCLAGCRAMGHWFGPRVPAVHL